MNACPLIAWPEDALHGACIMPPVLAWNGVRYQGSRLQAWDHRAAQALPGVVTTVAHENFLGVVAVSSTHARQASDSTVVHWSSPSKAMDTLPASTAAAGSTYQWTCPQHLGAGESEVTVWVSADRVGVWLPPEDMTAAPAVQAELSQLLQLHAQQITLAAAPHAPPPVAVSWR